MKTEEAIREAKKAEETAMSVSEQATKTVKEAKKISEETLTEVSMKTEAAVKEAKKVEEVAVAASQDALKKAEVVRKASTDTLEEALVKVEQTLISATEDSIPKSVLSKIIKSRQFLFFSLIMLIVSVMAAVCISLGLGILLR